MKEVCYLNGAIVPMEEARVSVLDLGMLRGFGIYEGITAVSGEPFHFTEHFERFERSAAALGLHLPIALEPAREATREVLRQNGINTGRASIRMLLTGGEALGGLEHVAGRETFYIWATAAEPLPPTLYEQGGSLIMHEHQRFMPGFKTTNYITAVTLQGMRKAAGAIEVLYTSQGSVLECATSNAFIVKDGRIITPHERILPGITRQVTLQLAIEAGYPIEERSVPLAELFAADETFITSSFKDIVPIISVDEKTIGAGTPGPVTRDLMERFAQELSKT